jgi:tetratricopeptide (TPR) repeat protein
MSLEQSEKAVATRCLLAALTFVVICAGVDAAQPGNNETRKQALAQLQDSDAAGRLAGCTVLAEIGRPEDLPLLQARLSDEDYRIRDSAEAAIWAIWSRSGDAAVDELFREGVEQMRSANLKTAAETFSRIISMRPQFTEAWNKRATVYFLLGQDDLSLKDCDEVVKRNPQHFGVLAGYGQIYLRKGDLPRAQEYFERALAVNPNMGGVQASLDAIRKILIKRGERYI